MILLSPHLKLDNLDRLNPYTIFTAHTVRKTGEHNWRPKYFFKTAKGAYEGIVRMDIKPVTEDGLRQLKELVESEEELVGAEN